MGFWKKLRKGLKLVPEALLLYPFVDEAREGLDAATADPPRPVTPEQRVAMVEVRKFLDRLWAIFK